jgi:hypothetical protein
VLVTHAEVMQPHHGGARDALRNLIFLQKAPEGIHRLLWLVLAVAGDLEHHQRAGALAFGQERSVVAPLARRRMQR